MGYLKNKLSAYKHYVDDTIKQLELYSKAYTERDCNLASNAQNVVGEAYGLLNERGLVKFLPRESVYPSWLANYCNILKLYTDETQVVTLQNLICNFYGKPNTIMSKLDEEELSTLPNIYSRHQCFIEDLYQQGYIQRKIQKPLKSQITLNNNVNSTSILKLNSNEHTNRSILTPARSNIDGHKYSASQVLPDNLKASIGVLDNIIYTTTTSLSLGAFDPLNAGTGVEVPCKDTVLQLLTELLSCDSRFFVNTLGETVTPSILSVLKESEKSNIYWEYIQLYLNQKSSVENAIYPVIQNDLFMKPYKDDSPYFELLGSLANNKLPAYILQRGTNQQSGLTVHMSGAINSDKLKAWFKEKLSPDELESILAHMVGGPIGIAEPLFTIVQIGEGSFADDSSVFDLSNIMVWDFYNQTLSALYTPVIKKADYKNLVNIVSPITNIIISHIMEGKSKIPIYASQDEFYNSINTYYNDTLDKIYNYQVSLFKNLNTLTDNYKVKQIPASMIRGSLSVNADIENLTLKKYHERPENKCNCLGGNR